MLGLSPWHLILFASIIAGPVSIIPIWRIVHRLGLNPAWSLLYFVPIGGLIGLWLLAWAHWPKLEAAEQAKVF